ncbi:MAG: RIP metalloprotease RseP [Firmicutes bacterium]|nr:RIP metalloprotease RseP [Bacillota bacterium]
MKTAILVIILFCIMIFPHELGHFIAARRMGVKVNEFAFGMGPAIWKKQGKETLYSIRLLPIGGFCAMEGEDGSEGESHDPRALNNKKPWQKIVILAAGSFMNVVCAVLIMSLVVGIMGFTTTTIAEVTEGYPAEAAGMMPGDKILQINDVEIKAWNDVSSAIYSADGAEMSIAIERDGNEQIVKVTPAVQESTDAQGNPVTGYVLGINCKISHNPFKAVAAGAQATWNMTVTLVDSLKMMLIGDAGVDDLSGPVGMVTMVNQTTQYGFWYYGFLTAFICLNLAVVNMLPLPALDGGRILFALYTAVTGKEVSEKVEGTIHFAGMMLLFGLMIYVTFNDITRIFG